jgi:hypothetical protein
VVRVSLGDQLRAFAGAELLGEHAIRRARIVAERAPLPLFPWGFEIRLGADDRVDFGGAVTRSEAGRLLNALSRHPALRSHPAWVSIARFARAWRDERRPLGGYIPFIGLEFDLPDEPPMAPVPSVFALLDWPIAAGTRHAAPGAEAAAQEALSIFCEPPPPSLTRSRLAACFRHLDPHSRVLSVGAMLGRTGAVRVFAAVPREGFGDYLRRCEWPGDASAVACVVDRFAKHFAGDVVQVQMDVGPTLGGRLGIEWSYLHDPDAAGRWEALTQDLAATHLVTRPKRERLLAWPGSSAPSGAPFVFRRDISHLKLVLDGARPVEVKAYVAITLVA